MESFFILKSTSKSKRVIAAKNGFSFYFLFLGPILGIFKGLWMEVFISIIFIYLAIYLAPELSFFSILISSIFWGFFGKDLYIQKLLKLNYMPEDIITSESSKKAILIFSSKNK